jgi:hypothetical protein
MHEHVCVSQHAHASTQVTTRTTHTPQRTTPTNFCASLTTNPSGGQRTPHPRAQCRGLARCSGHDQDDGPAAVGRHRQPGHHDREGLAVGEPHLGPAQVLIHDSRRPAGGDAGKFHLALLISDLSPSPSLLGGRGGKNDRGAADDDVADVAAGGGSGWQFIWREEQIKQFAYLIMGGEAAVGDEQL